MLRYNHCDEKKIISNIRLLKYSLLTMITEDFRKPTKDILHEFRKL